MNRLPCPKTPSVDNSLTTCWCWCAGASLKSCPYDLRRKSFFLSLHFHSVSLASGDGAELFSAHGDDETISVRLC